jgi:anti-sigma28 factor (negative regulator of flagellin synthesis)
MVSQINSSALQNAYSNKSMGEVKQTDRKDSASVSKQGDTSKVEQIKSALESGEYKVNLQALSQKIAEELL